MQNEFFEKAGQILELEKNTRAIAFYNRHGFIQTGGRWGSSGMEKKFESETFKQLIGGSTVSYACSMQGYNND